MTTMTLQRLAATTVLAWVLLPGCSWLGISSQEEFSDVSQDSRPETVCRGSSRRPVRSPEENDQALPPSEDTRLKDLLSGRTYQIAAAVNLVHLLLEREAFKTDGPSDTESKLDLLQLDFRINQRLLVAMADASSTSGKVRCERSRAEELADSLERNKDRRKERRTVGAIVAGAATNILTGVFSIVDASTTGGALGIAGGVAQYLFKGSRVGTEVSVDFHHADNYLKDVWEGPKKSKLFPPSVWRFLTYTKEDGKSLREEIIEQWRRGRQLNFEEKAPPERYAVLFGEGGNYNVDQLRARSAMLELLATHVELVQEEIDVLLHDLVFRQ